MTSTRRMQNKCLFYNLVQCEIITTLSPYSFPLPLEEWDGIGSVHSGIHSFIYCLCETERVWKGNHSRTGRCVELHYLIWPHLLLSYDKITLFQHSKVLLPYLKSIFLWEQDHQVKVYICDLHKVHICGGNTAVLDSPR